MRDVTTQHFVGSPEFVEISICGIVICFHNAKNVSEQPPYNVFYVKHVYKDLQMLEL